MIRVADIRASRTLKELTTFAERFLDEEPYEGDTGIPLRGAPRIFAALLATALRILQQRLESPLPDDGIRSPLSRRFPDDDL